MIYNVHNEVVCDYNCDTCDVAESCTDKIESNNINRDKIKSNKLYEE